MSPFIKTLRGYIEEGVLTPSLASSIESFYNTYHLALQDSPSEWELAQKPLLDFLNSVASTIKNPPQFLPYHEKVRAPFDFYSMGLNLFRPLVLFEQSRVLGKETFQEISCRIEKGENVILLSNHQAEPDPQVISLLLEKSFPQLAEEMIFVAGHRVVTDPLTIPFSMGRNLLCIYSKRHMDTPPEKRKEKMDHNQSTMKRLKELLDEGGKCIYVAPSGGRDRKTVDGKLKVAAFDPQSIEMFYLLARHAKQPTHFYPLSLFSYDLLPPPDSVIKQIGEERKTKKGPLHLSVGKEIDMKTFPGCEEKDKHLHREKRAEYIWSLVQAGYENLFK